MAGEDTPRADPPRTGAASLQAHDNVDIALSEELFAAGCPLCRHRDSEGRRYLRNLVYEGVNDVGFRRVLDRSRGFCGRHTVGLFEADHDEMGGTLGTAILLETVLRVRLEELAARRGGDRREAGRKAERSMSAPACPACIAEDDAVRMGGERLLDRLDDAAWRVALETAPLCLADLLGLALLAATSARRSAAFGPVFDAHLARMESLRTALADYAHHIAYDRQRHLTPGEHASAGRAVEALGGREGWEWRHRRGHGSRAQAGG